MNWLSILGCVVIVVAIISVFGFKSRGTRPVSGTRLMTMARIALVAFGLILLYLGFNG